MRHTRARLPPAGAQCTAFTTLVQRSWVVLCKWLYNQSIASLLLMHVCKQRILKVNPRARVCMMTMTRVCGCVWGLQVCARVLTTGDVWCGAVCQKGTPCFGSVVISRGYWNERTRWPAVELRTLPPLTHARPSVSCSLPPSLALFISLSSFSLCVCSSFRFSWCCFSHLYFVFLWVGVDSWMNRFFESNATGSNFTYLLGIY